MCGKSARWWDNEIKENINLSARCYFSPSKSSALLVHFLNYTPHPPFYPQIPQLWGPSLRAFWPRLSKLYSVLGLPLVPGVLGQVVSAFKQKVGGSIPAGTTLLRNFFSRFFSLRNPSGLQTELTTFVAMAPKLWDLGVKGRMWRVIKKMY